LCISIKNEELKIKNANIRKTFLINGVPKRCCSLGSFGGQKKPSEGTCDYHWWNPTYLKPLTKVTDNFKKMFVK
jgi:hypothetical protein